MHRLINLAVLSAVLLAPMLAGPARAGEPPLYSEVVDLQLSGTAQRVLYLSPPHPRGTLIMLPGGPGVVGIETDGSLKQGGNFVVRTRQGFARAGYAVIVPDAPGHHDLKGLRSTKDYADILRGLIAFAAQRAARPVFLVGTSQGAIAAVKGAAHAEKGTLAGVVLSSSVSRRSASGETVFDADPAGVGVPVLIVANSADACKSSPPADAQRIAESLTHAASVAAETFRSSEKRDDDCSPHSPHGYLGIEGEVIARVTAWLDRLAPAQ